MESCARGRVGCRGWVNFVVAGGGACAYDAGRLASFLLFAHERSLKNGRPDEAFEARDVRRGRE